MANACKKIQKLAQKWGNSIAIPIPKDMADDLHIENNTQVSIEVVNGKLVIVPEERKLSLENLLSQVTDENRHEMTDWGEEVGRDKW